MSRRPLRMARSPRACSLAMPLGARGASIPSFTAPISARVGGGPWHWPPPRSTETGTPTWSRAPGRVTPLRPATGRSGGAAGAGEVPALAVAVGDLNETGAPTSRWRAGTRRSSVVDGRGGRAPRRRARGPSAGRDAAGSRPLHRRDRRERRRPAGPGARRQRGRCPRAGMNSILLESDGSFSSSSRGADRRPPLSVLAADLNGDGIPDLVGATGDTGRASGLVPASSAPRCST